MHAYAIGVVTLDNLSPRDTNTYKNMHGFLDAYAEGKKEAIYDMARYGHRRGNWRY